MIFRTLLQYCKVKAIADLLSPNEESYWRESCRYYSKTFNTPLHEVERMDPEHVLLHNFENQIEHLDIDEEVESLLEQVYRVEDPDYDKHKEEDLGQFIQNVQAGAYEKKPAPKKALPKKEVVAEIPKDTPTSGSVDFSNLKNEG